MASIVTTTSNPLYATFSGDLDIYTPATYGGNSDSGTGSIYMRASGQNLYVAGITNLFATTITTGSSSPFYTQGTGGMVVNLTGVGAGTGLSMTSAYDSSLTVSGAGNATGTLTLSAAGNNIGTLLMSADGPSTANPSINISATNASSGQVIVQSAGTSATYTPVLIQSTGGGANAKTIIQSNGTSNGAITLTSSAGGIDATATGLINITTTNTSSGITIGTTTTGTPIFLGTTGSLTTVNGDLVVRGTTTSVNTTTLTFLNNSIILNSANNLVGNDAGVAIRRYQVTSNSLTGSVIANVTNASTYPLGKYPIQESGVAQAGGAGNITLAKYAYTSINTVDNYYSGWWIHIYAGTCAGQIRRIKSYNGVTQIASIYTTADNVLGPTTQYTITTIPTALINTNVTITLSSIPTNFVNNMVVNISGTNTTPSINGDYIITYSSGATFTIFTTVAITVAGTAGVVNVSPFTDGLDWFTQPPDATSAYNLYSASYVTSFYNETSGFYQFNTIANAEDGITNFEAQQPQNLLTGEIDIAGKTYKNAFAIPSGTDVIINIENHQLVTGMYVKLLAQRGFSTSLPSANPYYVTVLNADQFQVASGTMTPSIALTTSSSNSWSLTSNVITLTTVTSGAFAVGMIVYGTGILGTAVILSVTGGGITGGTATIAPYTGQTNVGANSNILTGVALGATALDVYFYNTSILKTNVIQAFDPEFPISIPGISLFQQITIPKTSSANFAVTLTSSTFGAYMLLVCDVSGIGASSIFACTNQGGVGNSPSRIVSTKGSDNQRISANWNGSQNINIFQQPQGGPSGNYIYQVRILSCL